MCVFGCFVDFVTFLCFALPGSACVLVRLWAITLRRSLLRKSGYVSGVYAYDWDCISDLYSISFFFVIGEGNISLTDDPRVKLVSLFILCFWICTSLFILSSGILYFLSISRLIVSFIDSRIIYLLLPHSRGACKWTLYRSWSVFLFSYTGTYFFSDADCLYFLLCNVRCGRCMCICDFNLLKTKRRLPHLKTQFVPRSKHFSFRL
jgi:hypothetical protein